MAVSRRRASQGGGRGLWVTATLAAVAAHALPVLAFLPSFQEAPALAGGAYFVEMAPMSVAMPASASRPSAASAAAAAAEAQEPPVEEMPEKTRPEPASEPEIVKADHAIEKVVKPPKPQKKAEKKPKPQKQAKAQPSETKEKARDEGRDQANATRSAAAPLIEAPQQRDKAARASQATASTQAMGDPRGAYSEDLFARWRALVARRLEQNKRYPRTAERLGHEGQPGIGIRIDHHGKVLEAWLEESCGYRLLDIEAVKMVHRASPLPPPPPQSLHNGELALHLPIVFERNY